MVHIKRAVSMLMVLLSLLGVMICVPQTKADAAFVVDYDVTCDAVYMVNLDTDMVVYEKNGHKQKYPASMTKLVTCMITLEYFSDPKSENVTISRDVMTNDTLLKNGVWSTGALKEGERIDLEALLYCAMLPSDNYAALAIAYFVSAEKGDGTLLWFIDRMNEKAIELGCNDTQFMNPHGLYHEDHYTTAHDMYLLAKNAMQVPGFANIVSTTVYNRKATNKNDFAETNGKYRLENTNKMLSTAYEGDGYYYQYVKGIKTGFIQAAGHTLATYATRNGYSYITILMDDGATKNSEKNYCMIDAKALYQWAFTSLDLKELVSAASPVATVGIDLAWSVDTLDLYPAESFTTLTLNNVESSSIMVKKNIPDTITAPVKKGDKLGTADLIYGSEVVGQIELVAGETVERSELLYVLSLGSSLFGSPVFIALLAVVSVGIVGYLVFSMLRSRNVGSVKRVRRYRRM